MNSLVKSKNFIKDNIAVLVFIASICFVVFFSTPNLTTKPRLWTDESLTMELARNFSNYGLLNIQTAPGVFFEYPYLIQSTGYPMTILLATVFKIFGYSFDVERILMLLIMIITLAAVFILGEKLFGKGKAALLVALYTSFASFYGSGRTGVGEVFGFLLLTTCLYHILIKENYYMGGLLLGLAVVTKPSVFLLAIPAIVVMIFVEKKDLVRKFFQMGVSFIPPILLWVFLVMRDNLSFKAWIGILDFYKNPYQAQSIWLNVENNLLNLFQSPTLIYFGGLFVVILVARYYLCDEKLKLLYSFIIAYSVIAFIYYLRSPGWLRYILIAELLILFIIPDALSVLSKKINARFSAVLPVLFLVIIQFYQLFTSAHIYSSNEAVEVAGFVNETFPERSVGVINSPLVSALLQAKNKYQSYSLLGLPTIGADFLAKGYRPEVIVISSDNKPSLLAEGVISRHYIHKFDINGQEIFVLKK